MFKKPQVTPNIYCNNPQIYLDNVVNDGYCEVLRGMSAEVLNAHLNELNGIAQENYSAGYYHGYRNGVIAGIAATTSMCCIGLGTYLAIKDIKSKKQK